MAIKKDRRKWILTVGIVIASAFYLIAILAGFLAPNDYREQTRQEPSAPPSTIRFRGSDGSLRLRPFIYQTKLADPRNMTYAEVTDREYPISFFVEGHDYSLLGLIRTNRHLFGIETGGDPNAPRVRLLGTDQLGRDRFSRLLLAIRFSLIVSPIGTLLACLIGVLFGAVSGYAGRLVDGFMMSVADTVISLPTLILILAARAAFPLELPPLTAATLLISIFALTGWAEMARMARGQVVAIRSQDYIMAARSIGLSESWILFRHILPNAAGPLIIQATLLLPVFFLAEISLSFLGVGLQEPEPSLGNMLAAATDMTRLRDSPFILLSPAIPIVLFVFAIRLIGWQSNSRT